MRVNVHSKDEFERWEASNYRCLLDGIDISQNCFAADDVEGWADCYRKDAAGMILIADGEVATERRYGRVELFRKDAVNA